MSFRKIILVRFERADDVLKPVTIEYRDSNGSLHRYTPDVFVRYRSTGNTTPVSLCVLCEALTLTVFDPPPTRGS